MSILNDLNEKQRIAASTINGVVRGIAGPGTGKTKTKTARIAHMIEQGINPSEIVALTFTNKAAEEMKSRIITSAGQQGNFVFAGTYHSFFIQRILKPNQHNDYFKSAGYMDGFFILDSSDSDRLLQQSLRDAKPDLLNLIDALGIKKKEVASWMGVNRAHGKIHSEVMAELRTNSSATAGFIELDRAIKNASTLEDNPIIKRIETQYPSVRDVALTLLWGDYTKRCVQTEGVDFDDVLVHADRLLKSDYEVRKKLANKYRYFSLDEYQDTNPVQHSVIHTIATMHENPNVFTVGDARQSIYGFRAADVTLMTQMDQYYQDITDVVLEVNYRSTAELLNATNALAKVMAGQITEGQLVAPAGKNGTKPLIVKFESDLEEANWISEKINELSKTPGELENTAILYRNRGIRASIEDKLLSLDIPYKIIGDVDFWERKETRDAVAVIRLLTRERDNLALQRVVDHSTLPLTSLTLRKNSEKERIPLYEQIKKVAYSSKTSQRAVESLRFHKRVDAVLTNLELVDPKELTDAKIFKAIDKSLTPHGFSQLHPDIQEVVAKTASNIKAMQLDGFESVLLAFYEDFIQPKQENQDIKALEKKGLTNEEIYEHLLERKTNVRRVFSIFGEQLKNGLSITEALDEIALRAEASQQGEVSSVKLMTNHASKGLEFKRVFVIGCEQESYVRDESDINAYDEEGRNFYVAVTRAEQELFMTVAATRLINGEIKTLTPLHYIDSLEPHCEVIDKQSINSSAGVNYERNKNQDFGRYQQDSIEELSLENLFANGR